MDHSSATRAKVLDGGSLAAAIKADVARDVDEFRKSFGAPPSLAAVRVGEDPASAVYVTNKIKACEEVGIRSEHLALPSDISQNELFQIVQTLNGRDDIDGILVQLPLPSHVDDATITEAIIPTKDVDGFHPVNVGRLALGKPTLVPCTPAGIIELLDHHGIQIAGANACVIGRSQIVGRPIAQLLLQRDATVTICHSKTRDLPAVARNADILVVAIGRTAFVGRDYVKPGATVIDVGMNKLTDAAMVQELFGDEAEARLKVLAKRGYTLIGDVKPAEVDQIAGARTPVPGGVGLLTVAMLMKNTLKAARLRR